MNSVAPIRIADVGGWTDTWFAGHGAVCNIAVYPCVEIQVNVTPHDGKPGRIVIDAENFGDRYVVPEEGPPWGKHPLLEAAIAYMKPPPDLALHIGIHSDVPAGASTGTSAAVVVALLAALARIAERNLSPGDMAAAAHHIEMDMVGLQCGIQDQIASAYGGINYIAMPRFPEPEVSALHLSIEIQRELERRLLLVYLGSSHSSSSIHSMVIRRLESAGAEDETLGELRNAAGRARDVLLAGDLTAYGRVLRENTEAQRKLHPELIGTDASRVIEIAQRFAVEGWKVNGAGGEGGSLTLLTSTSFRQKRALIKAIETADPLYRVIPTHISPHGVYTWISRPQ